MHKKIVFGEIIASYESEAPLVVWTRDTTAFQFFSSEGGNPINLNLANSEHERCLRVALERIVGKEKTVEIFRDIGELFQ